MRLASLKAPGPPAPGPITQLDGEVEMPKSLWYRPRPALSWAVANSPSLENQHRLLSEWPAAHGSATSHVTTFWENWGEGHIGRDNLWDNKHGVNIQTAQSGCSSSSSLFWVEPPRACYSLYVAPLGAPLLQL